MPAGAPGTQPVPSPGAPGEDGPCFLRLHALLPELLPAMEGPEEQLPCEVRGWVGPGDGCRVPGAPGHTAFCAQRHLTGFPAVLLTS